MPSKDETAQLLAAIHYDVEPEMREIYRVVADPLAEARDDEPVKLLEVNDGTIATGIMPLYFRRLPTDGIQHSSVIIEITPDEYSRVRTGELPLPHGWSLAGLIPRANGTPKT